MKQKDIKISLVIAWVGAVTLACGAGIPPRELVDAREAFSRAKAGPASTLALAELETAKQALGEAESAYRDGEDDETKNLAYVAERRSQLANAAGELEKANRDRANALKERQDAQDKYQRSTEEKLTAAQRALEEKARQSKSTEARLEAAEKKAAAALASLEQLAKVKEEARGVVITLSGSVLFATGKFELLPIARTKLDEVAKALTDQGYKSIVVEGHTDAIGGDAQNADLSQRRADSVRMYLVSQGITSAKISSVGLGESRPIADNSSPEGRANNRRVEIVVQPER